MIRRCNLFDWCESYIRAHPLREDSAYRLRRSCKMYVKLHGPELPDEERLCRFVEALESRYAAKTVHGHRANLLTIMRFAAAAGGSGRLNHDLVRAVRLPSPNPDAWEPDELARFFAALRSLPGRCPARPLVTQADYLDVLAHAGYESGLRKGDLFALKKHQFAPDGVIRLRQHKTSDPHTCAVRPETRAKILAIPYEYPLKWTASNAQYSKLWAEARRLAGLKSGATQQLRRTAATAVWERDPREVQHFLGHRTPDMWRHYVDQQRSRKPILPPEV